MLEAILAARVVFWKNLTVRDPRSPSRHPWRWCIFVIADILVSKIPISRKKSGVVVILVNRLGDAIVGRPLVLAMKEQLVKNNEPFMVIGDKSWKVLSNNIYDNVPVEFIDEERFRMNFLYRLKITIWLRLQNFRTAICFMHHRLEMRDDVLVTVSGADERIVSNLPFLSLRWYPWLFNLYLSKMSKIIPTLPDIDHVKPNSNPFCNYPRKVPHAVERFCYFWKQLEQHSEVKTTCINIPNEFRLFNKNIVILNPGASGHWRIWPLNEWVNLAYQIAELGYTICIVGGPAEERLVADFESLLNLHVSASMHSSQILLLINQISFSYLIGMFGSAMCYIGPDTGSSHLAYWLGTPTITLLLHNDANEEGDRFGDFFPYPNGFLPTPYRCVCAPKRIFHMIDGSEGIRTQVFSAFLELMGNPSNLLVNNKGN